MKQNNNVRQIAIFLLGTALGTTIGLILAALFTPYSGSETRERLKNQSTAWKDRVAAESDDFSQRIRYATDSWVAQMRDIADDLVERGQLSADEARTQINDLLEKVRS